jgi:hypothetical protein
MRTLESEILREARTVTGNKKLRLKDIMEWSTGNIKPHDGEKTYRLPETKVFIAIKEVTLK